MVQGWTTPPPPSWWVWPLPPNGVLDGFPPPSAPWGRGWVCHHPLPILVWVVLKSILIIEDDWKSMRLMKNHQIEWTGHCTGSWPDSCAGSCPRSWPGSRPKQLPRRLEQANQWKSLKINGNQWESMRINWRSMKINGNQWNQWKPMEIYGSQWKSVKTNRNQWKPMELNGNQ